MTAHRLRWEKRIADRVRYYEVHLERDLFGSWVVTRVWGRRGSRLGQVRHLPVADEAAGRITLDMVARERQRRGYAVVL